MAAPVTHTLYYRKKQPSSIEVLRFLAPRKADIRAMNVDLQLRELPPQGARLDPRLLAHLRQMRVTQIPALVTTTGVHLGANAIVRIYRTNLQGLAAAKQKQQQQQAPPGGEDLAAYYSKLLQSGDDTDDGGDDKFDPQAEIAKFEHKRKKFGLGKGSRPPATPSRPPSSQAADAYGDGLYVREGGTGEYDAALPAGTFDQTRDALRRQSANDPDYTTQDDLMMSAFMDRLEVS